MNARAQLLDAILPGSTAKMIAYRVGWPRRRTLAELYHLRAKGIVVRDVGEDAIARWRRA